MGYTGLPIYTVQLHFGHVNVCKGDTGEASLVGCQ